MDLKEFYQNKTILVAGGTGSIGTEIVRQLISYNPHSIRILSNSENELWETRQKFGKDSKKLRFLLGDIYNFERVKRAISGVDYVFNAAAIKHVPISEYNPIQAVNVNIQGLENIIGACFDHNVKKLVHISTDKAVNPTTVMGATKMIGERVCVSRSVGKGHYPVIISCVRFGNVLGSRGSIIPLIKQQLQKGEKVTLTSEKMNRFFMSLQEAVQLVIKSMVVSQGGEIFVLKMPTINIKTLIEAIIEDYAPKIGKNPEEIEFEIIGPRVGEKLDEELLSPIEFDKISEKDKMYIINNIQHPNITYVNKEDLEKQYIDTKEANPLSKKEIIQILHELDLL